MKFITLALIVFCCFPTDLLAKQECNAASENLQIRSIPPGSTLMFNEALKAPDPVEDPHFQSWNLGRTEEKMLTLVGKKSLKEIKEISPRITRITAIHANGRFLEIKVSDDLILMFHIISKRNAENPSQTEYTKIKELKSFLGIDMKVCLPPATTAKTATTTTDKPAEGFKPAR